MISYKPTDESLWQGRADLENGETGLRFHHAIKVSDTEKQQAGVMLLGFCCDEGVRRNKGRVGAKRAPDLIRKALANNSWHDGKKALYDGGNIY